MEIAENNNLSKSENTALQKHLHGHGKQNINKRARRFKHLPERAQRGSPPGQSRTLGGAAVAACPAASHSHCGRH